MATSHAAAADAASHPAPEKVPVPRGQRIFRTALGATAVVGAVVLFVYTAPVLLIFFFSIFLSVFFSGLAKLLHEHSSFTYRGCLAFVLLGLASILLVAGCIIGPAVAAQSASLSVQIPQSFHSLIDKINHSWAAPATAALQQSFNASKEDNFQNILRFAGLGLHGLGGLIFAVVIGIFLAADPELYQKGFLKLIPPARQARAKEVLHELGFTLWWWLIGQLATMASVGILVGIGLTILGVPLSGTLGLIAAILSFIPSLGPFISVIPAILLGLTISPTMGIWVVLLYLGVQTLEANVITPLIQHRAISMPPALILGSELLMGLLLGGAGLAFATPLAAVGLVLVNMLYVEDFLRQPGSLPSAQRGKRKKAAVPA